MANDKHLYELDELTTPQSNDLVMMEQADTNKDMKVKMGNFMPADTIASAVNTYLDGHSGYYVIPDGNVTMDKLATDVHQKFATKADIDGYYDEMSVGSAEQLLSNTYIPDNTPYLFRTSGGSLEIGDRVYEDAIVGGSVAWNQLVQIPSSNKSKTDNGVTITDNRDGTYTIVTESGGATANVTLEITSSNGVAVIAGHKYLKTGANVSKGILVKDSYSAWELVQSDEKIFTKSNNSYTKFQIQVNSGTIISTAVTVRPMFFDLTLMFGSTIADYIYTLEQTEADSGIAWLKSYGFFTKDYYAYNAGGIQSVKTSAKKVVGFNALTGLEKGAINSSGHETTNNDTVRSGFIRVKENQNYTMYGDNMGNSKAYRSDSAISFYDINKNFIKQSRAGDTISGSYLTYPWVIKIPSGVAYIRTFFRSASGSLAVDTVKNDCCFHLTWDGEKDGEYEAYEEHTYPLDSDLELRGIPKLDSSNKLYYDGDTYASDGTVTRRYGIVDLGTLTWGIDSQKTGLFNTTLTNTKSNTGIGNMPKILCGRYTTIAAQSLSTWRSDTRNAIISLGYDTAKVYIMDTAYTDAATFKTAMSGAYLVYELATATSESADPYTNPQIVSNWGTEEFVDERDVPVPVGHDSRYLPDLKAKLESVPNNPSIDGKYFLQYENGQATYVPVPSEVPQTPSEDGTYVLKATVASGVATLAWVAEE